VAKIERKVLTYEYTTAFTEDELRIVLAALRYKRTYQHQYKNQSSSPQADKLIYELVEALNDG